MGNCFASEPGAVHQRRGAAADRLRGWRATGIVSLPPGAREVPGPVLTEFPTAVKVLDATGAALGALPPELPRLVNLARLVAPGNGIASLPPSLGSLTALRVLNLDANALSALPAAPAAWSGLQRLETLSLTRNRLAALPAALGALRALRALCVAGNDIGALPPELGSCSALESLDASANPRLAALPAALGALTRLKTLAADGTAVAAVPPELLRGCVALQTLGLHGCPITAEVLQETEGFEEFEGRRRGKYTKIIAGGSLMPAQGLDEGFDRRLSGAGGASQGGGSAAPSRRGSAA
ncbi:hypothetical protein Rsub_10963 [Raphidocelis subcapitata]|uniref:Uncharacterized protein n=1 Tax=Raphidocelis subcapitata TaxID=307507 RepID=A0A2V0PK65_9CHLO|nr:hypothetical protein Rsub_10963 [Raphidocelis subcapitata]|eukprot:GBF98300.1 hypothetical protein Rsub_10963 [Raphidocelis subcapitata]